MNFSKILLGGLGLAVMDGVLQVSGGAARVGGALAGAGAIVNKIVSPTVPAFSNVTTDNVGATTDTATTTASTTTTTTAPTTTPAPTTTSAPTLTQTLSALGPTLT